MKQTVICLTVVAICCGPGTILAQSPEGEPSKVAQTTTAFSTSDASATVHALAEVEKRWIEGDQEAYFQAASQLTSQLCASPPAVWKLPLLQDGVARVVEKLDQDGSWTGETVWRVSNVVLEMLKYSKHPQTYPTDHFSEVRARNTTIALTLVSLLRKRSIPHYVNQNTSPNVAPPHGMPGFAGMDPNAINDPDARQAYLQAIKENGEHNRQNRIQHDLRIGLAHCEPSVNRYLVIEYSRPPLDTAGLKSKLDQAGYSPEQQAEILGRIPAQ